MNLLRQQRLTEAADADAGFQRDIIAAATTARTPSGKRGMLSVGRGMLGDFWRGRRPAEPVRRACPRQNSAGLMQVPRPAECENGGGALFGRGVQQQWQMKEMLSPRYTTRYGDLLPRQITRYPCTADGKPPPASQ